MGANYGCGDYECIGNQDRVVGVLNEIRLTLMESGEEGHEWITGKLVFAIGVLEQNAHTGRG